MSEITYYRRNREVMLNRANDYYENNKEVLRAEAKNIKRKYGGNRYHNMSEEKKQRLKEYQRNYREAKKRLS